MEGPTPVSALIHAATMVTAGVYLLCRVNPLLARAPAAATTVAVVGALTALFAATIACAQDDIKRVLAYSTISQLGYMFLAVGSAGYVAAMFHMVTHAFFKALLFLAAGSVIHGLHEQQDMKRMGGLLKWMPVTGWTFLVGWLAISGIPPFAGFWSKDDILLNAWERSPVLWAIGAFTALLTAYYMSRQVFLVFFGRERWRDSADEHAGSEAHGDHGAEPHESPWTMTLPLVALAFLSIVGGVINLPFGNANFLERWLAPVFGDRLRETTVSGAGQVALTLVVLLLVAIGIGFAYFAWLRQRVPADRLEPEALRRAWWIDPLYAAIIEAPGRWLSAFLAYVFDARIIDGAVNGVGTVVRVSGSRLRRLQTGFVRNYALGIALGTVLILGWMLSRATF
jgi:NADH-quinone oxidoreductase subunit L